MRRTTPRQTRPRPVRAVPLPAVGVLVAALVGTLAGCGTAEAPAGPPSPGVSATVSATSVFHVRDPWVKAADSGMTAAFGVLVNDGATDATIVGATSSVSPMELHEMAMTDGRMVMRPKADGLTVRAKDVHTLEPSGDHLMLMNLSRPVLPGDQVSITLTFADGRTAQFTAIAKPFVGAGESYDPQASANPSTGPAA